MKKYRDAAQIIFWIFLLAVLVVVYKRSNPTIKGSVVDDETGKPMAAAHVTVRTCSLGDAVSSVAKMSYDRTKTDSQGRFSVKPSYSHQWDLFVWSPGYYPSVLDARQFKGAVRLKKAKNSAVANVDWDDWLDKHHGTRSAKQLQEWLWMYYTANNLW